MSVDSPTRKPGPEDCRVGDWFLIADDPEVFGDTLVLQSWTSPDGDAWTFEFVEMPSKWGTDFGWRRIA